MLGGRKSGGEENNRQHCEISDAELNIPGYRVFRHDRNRHGGGVLVYVKNQFVQDASVVELSLFDDNFKFLPISFTFCNHRFCIATFYRTPSSSSSYFENLQFAVQQLDVVNFYSFVLVGDFNIDYFSTSHFLYSKLQNMLDSFCLTQVVTEPTHTSPSGNQSLIDLAIFSDVSQLIECNNMPPLRNSDHSSIEIKMKTWNS